MIGLCIILGIVIFILYVTMMGIMIILERDKPKNIIIWSIIFLLTQIVGYIVYILLRNTIYKKKQTLKRKEKEDEIYNKLIAPNIVNNQTTLNHEVFNFNHLAFDANITANNNFEIMNDYNGLKEQLNKDIENAKDYIIIEITQANFQDLFDIKKLLIEKAKENLMVRISCDRRINRKILKELRQAGVKAYRFSKYSTVGKIYSNFRNAIIIDGEIAYVANLNMTKSQLKSKKESACSYIKLKGSVVQDIDLEVRKDAIFSSGKFIPYEKLKASEYTNNNIVQFVCNKSNNDLELALIKAICTAKKSIQLELSQFIPTESIMSLLRFAINSNIEVRLMVPLKNNKYGKYFASRAYAKQLALYGANVYLFDGYINFNAITIDDEYVIFGSYVVDREHLNVSLQSMLFIKDNKAVKNFNTLFNIGIENSYRINDAKFLLMREKFFKNFV